MKTNRTTFSWPRHQLEESGQLHAPVALPWMKDASGSHLIGGWLGPKSGLDDMEKLTFLILPGSNPNPCPVAIPTALPRLTLFSIIIIINIITFWLPLWSSGESFWLQIQSSGLDSGHYQIFWEVVGLERSPLSLLSTSEELLERENSGSGNMAVGIRHPNDVALCIRKKLAVNSPKSGGHSVGIVRSWTQATEFFYYFHIHFAVSLQNEVS
jgi:hypothetical protein